MKPYSNTSIQFGYNYEKYNTINHRKAQRLSWFGHLHRKPKDRIVKKSIQVETDVNTTTRETKEQMER